MADTTVKINVDTADAERALGRLNNAITALAGAFASSKLVDFIDSATNLSNKLKLVTSSASELNKVTQQVLDISSKTGAEVNAVASLYSRLSQAQDTVGLTGEGVLRMTDLISKSLATAGLTVQEMSSVTLQLSQAFNSGRLQGDEFRSIAEAYPPLLKMVAKEMGVTVGELKKLGSEGKITGVVLRDAFLTNANEIEKNFSSMSRTLGQELNNIKNQTLKAFMEFDKATGFSQALATALRLVADNIGAVITAAATFLAVLAVQKIAAITVAVYELAAAGKLLDTILNGLGKGSWIAILITALVLIYSKIYDAMIKPLIAAGETGGTVAKFITQSFINGFLNIGEAALSIFPAIGKLIADSLTPGKDMTQSMRELQDIFKNILTQERVQLVSAEEAKRMRDVLQGQRELGQEAAKTGKLTKEAAIGISEEASKALKAFTDLVFKMATANRAELDRLQYGEKYAATQKLITEEVQKARVAGLQISENQKKDLANLVAQQFALKDIATTRQTLVGLADQITVLSERNVREQEIVNGLLQYQRSVTAETYELNKGTVNQYLRKVQTLKDMQTYNQALYEIDQQRALLSETDLRQREVAARLQQYQGQVSKEMFEATRDRVREELTSLQSLEQSANIQQLIKNTQAETAVASLASRRNRDIELQMLETFRNVNDDVKAQYSSQVFEAIKRKNLQQEINQLLEAEKHMGFGIGQEFIKLEDKMYLIQEAVKQTNGQLKFMQENLAGTEGFAQAEEKMKKHLRMLENMQQNYLYEDMMIRAKLEADRYTQTILNYDKEFDALELMLANELISRETYLKAVKDLEYRYADDIMQYKILKEMELQGNRAKIMAGNMNLLTVDRATAEKIAQDRVAFEKKTEFDKTQFFIDQSATVFNALGKQNKKAFEAAQALNIAVALMNTYRAASVALATYPWPFSLVAVAAAVATGMAQVAAIRSQSYSGRALGGGVMGGSSYIVGERGPELFTPTNSGKITRNQDLGAGGGTTVNFTVVANDTRGFDELLTARKGLITQIIQDAQLEKGRRI